MIRVLIADDEQRIRDGLATTIPWAELGMVVVGTAAHGEAALALARQTLPQIILTDVRMPRMDGIEFLKQVKAFLPRVRVVILSGYDDFAYAQQAVKLGVSDYLVKPVGAEEIQRVMMSLAVGIASEPVESPPVSKTAAHSGVPPLLSRAVCRGDDTSAYRVLGEWRSLNPSTDLETVRNRAIAVIDTLIQDLRREGFEFREGISPSAAGAHSTILNLDKPDAVEAWLDAQLGDLLSFVLRSLKNNHTLLIQRALEFIETRFTGPLTVDQVSAAVGLSPNYFSHLFKKVRGQGFKDHLNALRIEKAKKLLSAGGIKVYEVAHMVGFSDYKYFSAVYKKLTGSGPTR